MGRKRANKKQKDKIEKTDDSNKTLEITKYDGNKNKYSFESGLSAIINQKIMEMKQQYRNIIRKHNKLLELPSNLNFEIDPDKPSRYETLIACFMKHINDNIDANKIKNNETFKLKKLDVGKKILIGMHVQNIKQYLEETMMFRKFPMWRFIQFPINPSLMRSTTTTSITANNNVQEVLLAADFVQEQLKNETRAIQFIRILSYDYKQTRDQLIYEIIIPEITPSDSSKVELKLTERSLTCCIHFNGVNFVFEQKHLAKEIVPKKSFYRIIETGFVNIYVQKKEKDIWKLAEYFSPGIKEVWISEMKKIIKDLPPEVKKEMFSLDCIWKFALLMVNGGLDFLDLPADLNHVKRSFKSLKQMISYYKEFMLIVPHMKAIVIILSGAIYENLILSYSKNKNSKPKNTLNIENQRTSKYVEEITNVMKTSAMKIIEGQKLCSQQKFNQACDQFCSAINMFSHPKYFYFRSLCLFKMKKYKEAHSDSIRVLRNLGPIAGFDCMVNCLHLECEQYNVIRALDLSYSLPFVIEQVSENLEAELTFIRRKGLNCLKLLFTAYGFASRKKYELALPLFEQLSKTNWNFKPILAILYMILKKYENAYETENSLIDCGRNTVITWYIIGMSSYYMIDIDKAITCLTKISKATTHTEYIIGKVKGIKLMIDNGDKYMKSGNLQKALDEYCEIIKKENENTRLQSLVWLWIGNLQLQMKDYSAAIISLSTLINLNGGSVIAFRLRNIAYSKIKGMVTT